MPSGPTTEQAPNEDSTATTASSQTIAEADSVNFEMDLLLLRLIAKRNCTHTDQALSDSFYEDFYSNGCSSSQIEEKRWNPGRTDSVGFSLGFRELTAN